MAKAVLQSAQLEFLHVFSGNILGQVGACYYGLFWNEASFEGLRWRFGGVPLAESSWIGLLVWFSIVVRL